jgi:NAD(P)-dependent dehydrogenase (short-subunit alcohol dehydrogenase family)
MHNAVQDFVDMKGGKKEDLYDWLHTAQPLPRMGHPEEVAALVACIAKIPFCVGAIVSVDGGYTAQ